MKISTNFEDRNRIREWMEANPDMTAGQISMRVRVKEAAVQRHMDFLKPKPKKKPKPKTDQIEIPTE